MRKLFNVQKFSTEVRISLARLNRRQDEAAKEMGIPASTLSRLCAGTMKRPSLEVYLRVTAWLERHERKSA